MEYLWLIYWGVLLLSFIFGFFVMIKKNKLTGVLEIILSLVMPIWAFIFAIKSNYLNAYRGKEIKLLYDQFMSGNIEAIFIVILFLALFITSVYNVLLFKKKK